MALLGALVWAGCGTVEAGDNFVPPDLMLDEDFFYCRIQPEVITMHSCASGGSGEAGQCHAARSALRLSAAAEMESAPCEDGRVVGPVPASFQDNLDRVRISVQSDPGSSLFYRRPLQLDGAHPRQIFPEDSPAAMLIAEWINMGAM